MLTKDWHESHSTKRVSRVQEEAKKTSLLAPIAAKKYRYDIESRATGSEWCRRRGKAARTRLISL